MRRLATLALTLTVAGGATGVQAQGLPTAAALHDRFIEAIGGRDAVAAQQGRTIWAHFEVPSQGMTGPLQISISPPNKVFTKTQIPGMGSSTSGFDGEVAWTVNPAMGPMLLEGKALEQARQEADVLSLLNPDRYITSSETVAEEPFEGKPAYKVKVRTRWDEEYHQFYDKGSGFLVGLIRTQSTPMGDIEATTVMSDYEKHGALAMPTQTTVRVMGIEQRILVDSVKVGPVPDSVFALPPEIKALRKGS